MTGHWVMTGTIRRQPTTHDVDAEWVLKREYLRIQEVSRDNDGYEHSIARRIRGRGRSTTSTRRERRRRSRR
jgi:hypothetical protein